MDDAREQRDDAHGLRDDADEAPAERLRARAQATDRAARFEARLAEVERARERRRRLRRMLRIGWVVLFAAVGALAPLVIAAVRVAPDPTGGDLLLGAGVGAAVGALGPIARNWLASRRGAQAWDAYHERYVLFGDPSAQVRDADRPDTGAGGPPHPSHPSDPSPRR